MSMKKILTTLLAASLMLLGTQAFAQTSVNAGYLNSTLATKNLSHNSNGAFAGVSFNVPISGAFNIAPGLYYSALFAKDSEFLGFGSGSFQEHAINVPVYLNFAFSLASDTKFFIFGGPTAQYGLMSKVKHEVGSLNTTVDNYKDSDFNRFNVYLGGGVGFQAGAFQVTAGYDYGMMNQYKNTDVSCHRSNIKIGVGFLF